MPEFFSNLLGISGMVELTVRDADGNLKEHRLIHNATLNALIDAASGRLSGASTVAEADLYDNIQLCTTDVSGGTCTIVDLNGSSGGGGGNPSDTTATGPSGVGDGVGTYQAQNTFTCSTGGADCSAIQEIQLTAGTISDGTADTNRGAWQNVSTTLADGDTLQITWTVDID